MARKFLFLVFALFTSLFLEGCIKSSLNPQDPYEKYNRAIFNFNKDINRTFYKPLIKIYITVTPPLLQQGVSNFFNNLSLITTIPNDILQCKFKWMIIDFSRFLFNTVLGGGGLFDVATQMALPKHDENFAMTFAYYSNDSKPIYLVLPVIGPSTMTGAFTLPIDYALSIWPYTDFRVRYSFYGIYGLNSLANLASTNKLLDAAFDPYIFVRDIYLENQNQLIEQNKKDYIPRASRKSQL